VVSVTWRSRAWSVKAAASSTGHDRCTRSVSQMISDGLPLGRIVAEMEKCDIRCANCHRRKTYAQLGHKAKGAFVAKQDKAPDF
jgi:hypothetical protein